MASGHGCASFSRGNDGDISALAEELLSELCRQTNGAASEAIGARGIDYPINYGVSVAAIRAAAISYFPDDVLAGELYLRPEREARIAATYIADPAAITFSDADRWASQIDNMEIAGHVALLVGRSPDAPNITLKWLNSTDEYLHYAAIMTAARAVLNPADTPPLNIAPLLPLLRPGTVLADRAIAAFIGRAWRNFPAWRPTLEPFLKHIAAAYPRLWDELYTELDMH